MLMLVIILSLVILTIAAVWDIKTLEVPDWLNYGGIAAGLLIHSAVSLMEMSYVPILQSVLGLFTGLAIGALMYYTGQWGGGDAKLLMAVGALIGAQGQTGSFGLNFLINLMFMGAIWGLLYLITLATIRARKTFRIFRTIRAQRQYSRIQLLSTLTAILMITLAFFFKEFTIPLITLALLGYALFYLVLLVKSVELTSMHKWVTADKLVEGDWLVHDIYHKGQRVAGPNKTGLKTEELERIKELEKKKKIGKICVKYGIPFTPAFLLTFIVTLAFGNIILAIAL